MRAPRWAFAVLLCASTAHAEVTPQPVDLKPLRDKLLVFADSNKGVYIFYPGDPKDATKPRRLFYGTGKTLYEQRITGFSRNGTAWHVNTWAPRVSEMRPAYFSYKADGSYEKSCDGKDDHVLALLTGDKAKAVLDLPVMTEMLVQRPHLLARDDAGVYYYVDRLAEKYGGKGFRVFIGKKGAMAKADLTDIAADTGGEVFSTKTGDLRLTRTQTAEGSKAVWIRGEKRSELVVLNVDVNSPLIFRDLGVYKFTGTLCDNI
jgi:hypothetical protein